VADLPTRLDFHAIGRQYIVDRARKLDPAQVDVAGSDANLFVGIGSVVSEALIRQLGYRTGALLLDGSDDEDLDRYAYDRYGLLRKGASSARGTIQITRTVATVGAGSVPIGTLVTTDTGVEYVTTTVATFSSLALSSSCNVRAVQAGKATQIGAGAVKRFSRPGDLFDASLVPSNSGPTAGGEDTERDDQFRARIRDFWRTARRGVIGAIEFGALTVPGVVSAMALESLTQDGRPARIVNLYISDSSGVASDALAEEVATALLEYRAGGIAVLIWTSAPQIVTIELALQFVAGVDTRTLSEQVRAAVFEFVNSLPVNGPLYVQELRSVLQRFRGDGLLPNESSVALPVGDLIPAIGQTLRTTLENVVIL
jgi:uncharacterized phage protein gp47/JayE